MINAWLMHLSWTWCCLLAALTAGAWVFLFAKPFIAALQKRRIGQVIRELGPESHQKKAGVPTMGGALIVSGILVAMCLWAPIHNHLFWLLCGVLLLTALLGAQDDWQKIRASSSAGMLARYKFLGQCCIAVIACALLYYWTPSTAQILIPGCKVWVPNLSWGVVVLGAIVMVASSNAVNLTDGLDGLVSMPLIFLSLGFIVMAVVLGHASLAASLRLPIVADTAVAAIMLSAMVGALLAFLWFNAHPASIMMGDTGSLSLGALVGLIAVVLRAELYLVLMGGIFVLETLSVILQVVSFRYRGKRIFKMAPIHHHFELSGWPEILVTVRFWILSLLLLLLGLALFLL